MDSRTLEDASLFFHKYFEREISLFIANSAIFVLYVPVYKPVELLIFPTIDRSLLLSYY